MRKPCARCSSQDRKQYPSGHVSAYCACCEAARQREYRKKNPVYVEALRQHARENAWRRKKLGVSWKEFVFLLQQQNFLCACCGDVINTSAHLDHSHASGCIRGVLCENCNRGLGMFRDDPVRLQKAIHYVTGVVTKNKA